MSWQEYLARLHSFERASGGLALVHQKIAQIEALITAYRHHELPTTVPKLQFSPRYLSLHLVKHPELLELTSCLNELRQVLIENFGIWHVFTRPWLDEFKAQLSPGKSLVLMCGNGVLAANLPHVIAVDDLQWQGQDVTHPDPWCKVQACDAFVAVKKYYCQVANIILEWAPEQTCCDQEILTFLRQKQWQGNFIVIGEQNGATNSPAFWQRATLTRPTALNALHRPFDFICDQVFWVR